MHEYRMGNRNHIQTINSETIIFFVEGCKYSVLFNYLGAFFFKSNKNEPIYLEYWFDF